MHRPPRLPRGLTAAALVLAPVAVVLAGPASAAGVEVTPAPDGCGVVVTLAGLGDGTRTAVVRTTVAGTGTPVPVVADETPDATTGASPSLSPTTAPEPQLVAVRTIDGDGQALVVLDAEAVPDTDPRVAVDVSVDGVGSLQVELVLPRCSATVAAEPTTEPTTEPTGTTTAGPTTTPTTVTTSAPDLTATPTTTPTTVTTSAPDLTATPDTTPTTVTTSAPDLTATPDTDEPGPGAPPTPTATPTPTAAAATATATAALPPATTAAPTASTSSTPTAPPLTTGLATTASPAAGPTTSVAVPASQLPVVPAAPVDDRPQQDDDASTGGTGMSGVLSLVSFAAAPPLDAAPDPSPVPDPVIAAPEGSAAGVLAQSAAPGTPLSDLLPGLPAADDAPVPAQLAAPDLATDAAADPLVDLAPAAFVLSASLGGLLTAGRRRTG